VVLAVMQNTWNDSGGKKVIEYKMCAFISSRTSVRNIFHSKKNLVRYYHKCT